MSESERERIFKDVSMHQDPACRKLESNRVPISNPAPHIALLSATLSDLQDHFPTSKQYWLNIGTMLTYWIKKLADMTIVFQYWHNIVF